jgi:arginyl-tRNA synthetase
MGFGLILDKNNEKIKSRSGDTIKLKELLDEAKNRAMALSKKKAEGQEQ